MLSNHVQSGLLLRQFPTSHALDVQSGSSQPPIDLPMKEHSTALMNGDPGWPEKTRDEIKDMQEADCGNCLESVAHHTHAHSASPRGGVSVLQPGSWRGYSSDERSACCIAVHRGLLPHCHPGHGSEPTQGGGRRAEGSGSHRRFIETDRRQESLSSLPCFSPRIWRRFGGDNCFYWKSSCLQTGLLGYSNDCRTSDCNVKRRSFYVEEFATRSRTFLG